MSENAKTNKPDEAGGVAAQRNDRRKFLKLGSTGVAALALGAFGTSKTTLAAGESLAVVQQQAINLGTGDIAILNYAYLLEQLEADFYTRVVANTIFPGATLDETQILTDLRDHEIIHREFFRAVLGGNAIPQLTFDFSLINFNSRDSVLAASQELEDTGVAAYNGVGQAVQSADILALAGKIVSVEGRHAAAIRDLRIPRLTYFAPHSEDFALDPLAVLNRVAPFVPRDVTIDASGLPKTILV